MVGIWGAMGLRVNLSKVGDGSFRSENVDELFLVGVNVSLHYVHAWTQHSLERCHVQHYRPHARAYNQTISQQISTKRLAASMSLEFK